MGARIERFYVEMACNSAVTFSRSLVESFKWAISSVIIQSIDKVLPCGDIKTSTSLMSCVGALILLEAVNG